MANGEIPDAAAIGGQTPGGNIERRFAALEAVLPTLIAKADLADLRAEMRVQTEQLRSQNEQLRTEMRAENEKLRAEMQMQAQRLVGSTSKWMAATVLGLIIAFAAFFLVLGNLLLTAPLPAESDQSDMRQPTSISFSVHGKSIAHIVRVIRTVGPGK